MHYAKIRYHDIANGEGVRTSLFVSGCRNRCKGCFNPETWDFEYGIPFTDATIDEILHSLAPEYMRGLTILGGEPMEPENQCDVLKLITAVRETLPEKDIWIYTGFVFDDLIGQKISRALTGYSRKILLNIDVLVDGRFQKDLADISLRFRGSSNQRVIDMRKTLSCGCVVLKELYQNTQTPTERNKIDGLRHY